MFDNATVRHTLREKFLPSPKDYLLLANKAVIENQPLLAAQVLKAGSQLYPREDMLQTRYQSVCQALSATNSLPRAPTKKIFGIGLSRTGTASLNESLKMLGFNAAHWMLPETKKIIDWQEFLTADAVSDTPVSFIFEALYYAFPDSYFIYTCRDVEKWAQSIEKHFYWLKFASLKQLCLNGNGNGGIVDNVYWRMIHLTLYANCTSWADAYQKHEQRVSNFFTATPEARLLKIDITDPALSSHDKWQLLAHYLELADEQIPLLPFPKKNDQLGRNQRKDPEMIMTLPLSWQAQLNPNQFAALLASKS